MNQEELKSLQDNYNEIIKRKNAILKEEQDFVKRLKSQNLILDGTVIKDDKEVWLFHYDITYNDRYVGEKGWIYDRYRGIEQVGDEDKLEKILTELEGFIEEDGCFSDDFDDNKMEDFCDSFNELFDEECNPLEYRDELINDFEVEVNNGKIYLVFLSSRTNNDWHSVAEFSLCIKKGRVSQCYTRHDGNNDF